MREQMEALRPQYEAAARAIEHVNFTALNDGVEQSLATSYGTDLAEAAYARSNLLERRRRLVDDWASALE